MKSQKTQIREAKRAYIIAMTKPSRMGLERFCIYLDDGDGLEILWPNRDECTGDSLLRYQVQTTRNTLPPFHFALSGSGYCKTQDLTGMLKEVNPDIKVLVIGHGYSPSLR
jgi:hypothetical protein